MAIRCRSCGQDNREGAVLCEFCKELFVVPRPAERARVAPPPLVARPPRGRWSTPQVLGVAALSAAAGFGARAFQSQAPPPPPPPVVVAAVAPARATRPAEPVEAPPIPEPQHRAEPPETAIAVVPQPIPPPAPPAPVVDSGTPAPTAPAPRQIRVPYQAFEGSAQRIIIPVVFNGSVPATMALDTGAPSTVIFTPLAERLGVLNRNEGRLATLSGGIGGQTAAVLVVLDSLAVSEARTEFVPATVVAPMTSAFEGLVGMDFLGDYQVQIDTTRHELVLTEVVRADAPGGHDERWWRELFHSFGQRRAEWERVHQRLTEYVARSEAVRGLSVEQTAEVAEFAAAQGREVELLADRLERHASRHSVPREWRAP